MMQELVAGLIVVLAALYAAARFMPAAWRRRIVARLSRRGQGKLARMVDSTASCGGSSECDTCGTCDGQAAPAARDGKRVIRLRVER